MNQISVKYGNIAPNIPKQNTRKNTIRFAQKNYRSSNVKQHANHYLPEKQYAPRVQILGKHANAFTQKSKLGNYAPAVLKSAHAPQHTLLARNTGTRRLSQGNRLIRTNGTRKLFRK